MDIKMGPYFLHLRKAIEMHGWTRYLLAFLVTGTSGWLRTLFYAIWKLKALL